MRMPILVTTAALLGAAPLHAQIWAPPGDGLPEPAVSFDAAPGGALLHDARDAIRDGRRSGQLTRAQGKRLRRERAIVADLAERYAADGLTPYEAQELDSRAQALLDEVQAARAQKPPR